MLRTRLSEALKDALKSRDERSTSTLRLILAALKDRDIAARTKGQPDGIGEEEILQMLQSMVKQRRESIAMYEQGGRLELAEREAEEITVIERYLPKQMSEAEVAAVIDATITSLEASGLKDMGRVMAALRERYAGQMDFGKASQVIKARLSA